VYWRPYFSGALLLCLMLGSRSRAEAQQQPSPETLQRILDRLDSLEKQNETLLKEIHDLRQELSGQASPPVKEQVEAVEQQTKDLAQTRVSASQRFPVSLTGMFLFDATKSGRGSSYGGPYGNSGTGATLRQSIIGLEFYGPHIFGDGQIHGSLSMDFYSGTQDSVLRIRRGVVSFDWRRRSITFGQDKPLIAPLQPTSFARVGIPPLSGAGNLWLWLPQVKYEERIPIGTNTELKAQAAIVQTAENYNAPSSAVEPAIAPARPAAEVRLEYQRSWNDQPRLALGFGAHTSTSHAYGESVPSRVVSADFRYQPKDWLQFSGTLLHGENFANLGGLGPGLTASEYGVAPVRASAGWIQVALPVTSRLTFDLYAGRQLNAANDLNSNAPLRSLMYAGNILYRVAPNVVLGFEGGRSQVTYLNGNPFSADRYDATVAYLF
jgi:hypothetical protein